MVKETVSSLARKVMAGEMDAYEAGKKMKAVVTVRKSPETLAEKRESYNDVPMEIDPNAFLHVEAFKSLGILSQSDYKAICKGLAE